jgi:hypothetical protein
MDTPSTLVPVPGDELASGLFLTILAVNCGICHQRPDANAPPGPLDFSDDIARMLELGLIVPLRSDLSPIYQVMRDGSMPPPGVEPRPIAADIEIIRLYIDTRPFWPDAVPPLDGDADAGAALPGDLEADGGP